MVAYPYVKLLANNKVRVLKRKTPKNFPPFIFVFVSSLENSIVIVMILKGRLSDC